MAVVFDICVLIAAISSFRTAIACEGTVKCTMTRLGTGSKNHEFAKIVFAKVAADLLGALPLALSGCSFVTLSYVPQVNAWATFFFFFFFFFYEILA